MIALSCSFQILEQSQAIISKQIELYCPFCCFYACMSTAGTADWVHTSKLTKTDDKIKRRTPDKVRKQENKLKSFIISDKYVALQKKEVFNVLMTDRTR